MGTFYMNHEAELYHAYMAAYDEEFYGDNPNELYHYGRKGMRRGMHLPDVLDPTRELIGKRVDSARRVANLYARRVSKYGTMAGKYLNKKYDQASKAIAKRRNAKRQEEYELEEYRKYKAEKAAKAKNKSLQDTSNRKAEASKATIDSLRKDLNAAIDAGDHDKVTSIRKAIEKTKLAEANRKSRETARNSEQYRSSTARNEAMAEYARKQKHAQSKAAYNAEQERLKDPRYAQKKANEAASKASGEAGIARMEARKKANDAARKRQEDYAKIMKRDADERARQARREKEEAAYRRYNRRNTVSKGYKR